MTCTARTRQPIMPKPLSFDEDPFGSLYNQPQEDEMFPVFPCEDILFPKSFENDKKQFPAEDLDEQDGENIDDIASIFESLADQADEICFEPEKKKEVPVSQKKKLTKEQSTMAQQLGISQAAMLRMLQTKLSAQDSDPPKSYIPIRTYLPPSAVAVDFRCFEPTAFAQGKIDIRIPSIVIPKMDAQLKPQELEITKQEHDEKACDICQSNKTPQRKAILHRWRIRRQRRNWTKGPRYNGRSNVASNRTRVNGRFVPTARWI